MSEDIEGQVLSPPREPPRRKDSVSEAATGSSQGAPWLLRFFEIPFRIRDPTNRDVVLPEVTAWAMDHSARGVLNTVGAYVGLAVLVMASIEAGDSENTVRAGLKPSSLLTATSAIVGVIAAALMPIVGAIVDHTQYRRFTGSASALILTALTGMMLALDLERNNWFFVLIVESILSFFLTVHATASFAYLPDLTPDPSVIPQYTASFLIRQASCQFIFTCLLLILGKVRGSDRSVVQTSIDSSIDATSITFGTCVLCLGYAWGFLFRPRPAISKTPEGQPLIATGFLQVKKTAVIIWTKYRALKWFMLSLLWSPESGSGVVVSVAVSYLGTDIGYSGQDLAKLSLIYLSASVAGALMAKWADSRLNTLNIYRSGLVVFVFGLALCVAIVDGPEDKQMSLGIVPLWGLANGWAYSAQRALIVTLIPKGQETEFMGLFFFMGQILGWLPPLIVTILNENGVGLRYGLGVMAGFYTLALCFTLFMGDYETAVELVAADSQEKLAQVIAATKANANARDRAPTEADSAEQTPPDDTADDALNAS